MSSRSIASPRINFRLSATLTNTLDDATSVTAVSPYLNYVPSIANGVSAGQANRAWHSLDRTILQGAQETIDLYDFQGLDIGAGNGNDAVGQALTLEEIVLITLTNNNAVGADGSLEIIPAASEGWTPIGSHTDANGGAILGQGILLKANLAEAGFDVAANSHRITMRAVGGDVEYSIHVLGRHDDNESSSSSLSSSSSSTSSPSSSSLSSSSSSQSASASSVSSSSQSMSTSSSSSTSSQSTSSQSESSTSSSSTSSSSESSSSLSSET